MGPVTKRGLVHTGVRGGAGSTHHRTEKKFYGESMNRFRWRATAGVVLPY